MGSRGCPVSRARLTRTLIPRQVLRAAALPALALPALALPALALPANSPSPSAPSQSAPATGQATAGQAIRSQAAGQATPGQAIRSQATPGQPGTPAETVPPGSLRQGPARQYRASTQIGTCGLGPAGRRSPCPRPVPAGQLPPGARNRRRITSLVSRPAALVDTRTWTTGGGNTFPGADVPFGMVQWSPDTLPHRNDGGGYNYGDRELTGYSLTHLSGPGCSAAGDVPILPLTGSLPGGDPSNVVTPFSNDGEVARAGYYSARSNQPATITSRFTATPHSSMGRFAFPPGRSAAFLVKLLDSQNRDLSATARIVSRDEVSGSDTSGNFCLSGAYYTVYFDIVFSRPFRSARIITRDGPSHPDAIFLTFGKSRVITAKASISYVSIAGARRNWRAENPGWHFGAVRAAAQRSWNRLLRRIQVAGGTAAQTQEFYSLLYKGFLQPNITSDVTGRYRSSDGRVHRVSPGQRNQYGMFSGWDIYHSLCQLQAMLDPQAASDMAQSLINYYTGNRILQQWGYLNLDTYAMVGDPADAIIADYYAFGARHFHARRALADMLRQATTVNPVRPGEALEQRYGYLPEDARYGCCHARGFVSSLLEYDTADFALSRFAAALGDRRAAARLGARASNWAHVFDRRTGLLTPRLASGRFVPLITPDTRAPYVEGSAEEYTWDVPDNYAGLFALLGGKRAVAVRLRRYLSRPAGGGRYARLQNEFDLGEQNALDYAGDPAGTQQAVNRIRTFLYRPGPSGLRDNDDLGGESSQFIWEMLGMYPENPGTDLLVFASPGFPRAVIHLRDGRAITIRAAGASPSRYYVRSLRINGRRYRRLWVPYSVLARGSRLTWALGNSPSGWGSAPGDAPPSFGRAPAPPR